MALPPTLLTSLIYAGPDTAARVRALADGGSLIADADLDAVARVIDEAFAHVASMPPGWCGPTGADVAASRLSEAGLLSAKGERQRHASPDAALPYAPAELPPAPWWARSRLLFFVAVVAGWSSGSLALFAVLPFFGSSLDVSLAGRGTPTVVDQARWLALYASLAAGCAVFLVLRHRRLRSLPHDDGNG